MKITAIQISEQDNVVTVIKEVAAGEHVTYLEGEGSMSLVFVLNNYTSNIATEIL